MGSKIDDSSFTYQSRAAIADLDFTLDGVSRMGYAVFISGKSETGYALAVSAPTSAFGSYSELITSCLDAFSIDRAPRRFPGPVSQFLFPLPAARDETKTVALPAGSATLPWSSKEAQEELSVAEREFRILILYLNTQTLWIDAWGRYYRMVYKESAAELDTLTEALTKLLPADDPTETARKVLAWVQGFQFARDFSGINFIPPLTAAFEKRGDCDFCAMVMAIILERRGIDAVLMVSREHSHAMLAVDVPGGGQRFSVQRESLPRR